MQLQTTKQDSSRHSLSIKQPKFTYSCLFQLAQCQGSVFMILQLNLMQLESVYRDKTHLVVSNQTLTISFINIADYIHFIMLLYT